MNWNLKAMLGAVVMAVSFVISPMSANAVSIDPFNLGGGIVALVDGLNYTDSQTFSSDGDPRPIPGGGIVDFYKFNTSAVNNTDYSASVLNADGGFNFGIADLTLSWFNETTSTFVTSLVVTDSLGVLINGATQFLAFSVGDIYRLEISGSVLSEGGTYNIKLSPSAVPLPGAALFLLSGLAGMGFLGRYRMKKANA